MTAPQSAVRRVSPPDGDAFAAVERSTARFVDGGAYRVEIPSVEGPEALAAVLDEARARDVVIHRVSQGSGVAMLSDTEIVDMQALATEARVELCLFLGPRATWDTGASALSPSRGLGWRVRGASQLQYSIDDAMRAVGLGLRSLLVADEGVLWSLHSLRARGDLPADLRIKVSALSGPGNPASFEVLERLGADSINVPSDLSIAQLAELRAAGGVPMDFYVESPDSIGGFVRHHELPDLVAVAAPIYLKYGLRNAPDIYPSGIHLRDAVLSSARERVRRAELGMNLLRRKGLADLMSPAGSLAMAELVRFEAASRPATVAEFAA